MFFMWTCFSLLCAATILSSSASNEVSLKCNNTAEVVAGEDVTLNCSISYTTGNNCEVLQYQWSNSHGVIQCNSDLKEYICGWDKLTHVYLTISHVIEEENYTVNVLTDCDIVESSAIKVRIKQEKTTPIPSDPPRDRNVASRPTILGILFIIAVVGILCFLFRRQTNHQLYEKGKDSKRRRQ